MTVARRWWRDGRTGSGFPRSCRCPMRAARSPPGWEHTALGRPRPMIAPADLPAILGGLYYDLAGAALPVALDGLLAVAGPDRLLYGSDFPFTPAAAHLAAELRRAPALRGARRR